MITNLYRKKYKKHGGNKYHINCALISNNFKNINIDTLIRNKNDISVLTGIINNQEIMKNNKHIVVKIGNENKTIETEFTIGNILENAKIPGFISFMCIFSCFDNTHEIGNTPTEICIAPHTEKNRKQILLMPYIPEKSIKQNKWNETNFNVLQSVIQQVVISILIAYDKVGFLHNDLHLDNILLKKTKKKVISYDYYDIHTNGYKIVIMDFDSSWTNVNKITGIEFFWLNLYNMLSRVDLDLTNEHNDKIGLSNSGKILEFVKNQQAVKGNYMNALQLIPIIDKSSIHIIQNPFTHLKYNPNIFG